MQSQSYINANYTTVIEIEKSVGKVFRCITNDVSKWWPENFEGESTKLNDEFIFTSGESHYSKNKIIEFVPNKKVVWLVTESIRKTDNFEWTGTKMIFELTSKENNTVLEFTYDGPVFENEYERLILICDTVIKEMLYKFINSDEMIGNKSFTTTIEVARSSQDVFNCIKEVPKWWSEDFEGNSQQLNDEFIIHHPGQHYSKQKLIEVVADKKMVWLVTDNTLNWLEKDKHEWTNTKMIFELMNEDDKTVLHFTHEGLAPGKECYTMCEKGWSMIIKNWLLHFITFGTPSPEMRKAAEIRNQILADNTNAK